MGLDLGRLGVVLLLLSCHSLQAFPDTSINEIPETQPGPRPSRILGPVIKSSHDKREYRALILDNQMRVVLVSDKNASKAAVSMNIGVGSMNDPPQLMGLTHFMEHMIFLGSEKFPVENALQKWISDNGGNINAMTLPDHTTYFFTLSPSALKHSLEQLSEMLISPLFTDSALEREIQAVQSEHLKYRSRERRRIERVEAQTGRSGHPFCMYRTGTMETLHNPSESNLRAALLDHHLQYHSANLMGLAVFGTEDLDTLQSLVEETFLPIPNRNVSLPVWPENPYGENELGERVDIVPLGKLRSMQLIFPLPYVVEHYKSSPVGYVSYLLGLEGSGSLAFFLKRKGWIDALHTGVYRPARGFSFFKIEMKLTQAGLANLNNLTCHVFEYIHTLEEAGPQKWFWEEIRAIGLINAQYREEFHPLDVVKKVSHSILTYPLEKVLIAEGVDETESFNANGITQTFSYLRPSNLRLIVTAPEFANLTQFIEDMYGVNYNREKIPPSVLQSWSECNNENPDLHLPRRNEFIVSDFSLEPRDNQSFINPMSPRKVVDTNLSQVWYLQDTTFLLPKAIVSVSLLSPIADLDPLRSNLLQVWVNILDDLMMEFKYTATIAGLESNIQTTERGLQIHVRGFNDKLPQFLFKICQSLSNTSFTDQHFQAAKETLAQAFANAAHVSALEKANELHRLIMFARGWNRVQGMELMSEVTFTRVKSFIQEFLSRLRFVWVFYGNLSPEEASKAAFDCQEVIVSKEGTKPLFDEEVEIMRIVEVPEGSNLLITKNEDNIPTFSTVVAFQVGLYSPKRSVLTQLLGKMSYQLFFDQLRTQEQLGYTTGTDIKSDKYQNTLTFRLYVEGNKYHPSYVEARIDNFLLQFEGMIRNITDEEFRKQQKSLSTAKAMPPKTLEEKMNFLLREITNERHFFNQREVELQVLDSLGLKDLQDFFHEVVVDRAKRRRISIQVAAPSDQDLMGTDDEGFGETAIGSSQNGSSSAQLVTDINEWKKRVRLFPSLAEVAY